MKRIFLLIMLIFFVMPTVVNASNTPCNRWAAQGASVCRSKTYKGYKCSWNADRKGGARCYKSSILSEAEKDKITSCISIKDSSTCQSSKVNGHECIWRQGACYKATDDGSGETVVADDEDDRKKQEAEKKEEAEKQEMLETQNNNNNSNNNITITFDFCNDVGILKTFRLVGYAFIIIKILIPLLLIIFGAIDMGKAVVAGDEKAIKNASSMLMTRAIAGVIIFFVPTIIDFAAGLVADWTNRKTEFENCQKCIFDTDECADIYKKVCEAKSTTINSVKDLKCEMNTDSDTCECKYIYHGGGGDTGGAGAGGSF